MSKTERTEIQNRLAEVIANAERAELRGRLARASRSHYPQPRA